MAIKKISANLLGSNAVLAANIAGGAISAADIADNSITAAKISASTSPTLGGLDVTGTVTTDGLTIQTAQGDIEIANSAAVIDMKRSATNYIYASNAAGNLRLGSGGSLNRLNIANNGDISFYEDTGTTAKLFWDASAESLGIGTSDPQQLLHLNAASPNILLSGTSFPALKFSGSDNTTDAEIYYGIGASDLQVKNYNNGIISFTTNSNQGMVIDASGNVRLGTTDNASTVEIGDISGANYRLKTGSYSLAFQKYDADASGWVTGLTIRGDNANDGDPNVHIGYPEGQTYPGDAKFMVSNAGANGMEFSGTAISGENRILNYNRSGSTHVPMTIQASEFNVAIGGSTEYFKILSDGRINLPNNPSGGLGTSGTPIIANVSGYGLQMASFKFGFAPNGGNNGIKFEIDANGNVNMDHTGYLRIPRGTTAQRPGTATTGMIRYNTTLSAIEEYDGTTWKNLSQSFSASGGTVTSSGGYTYHTFTSSGTFSVTSGAKSISYLIVAGGGGGGYNAGAGGGAGGYRTGTTTVDSGTGSYTITIGAGGAGKTSDTGVADNGSNSSAFGVTSTGGGGGISSAGSGASGGSGGGGAASGTGGSGTSGQGNDGGDGNGNDGASRSGAGGGGAGAAGQDTPSNTQGGNGGAGSQWLNGSYYAGGGGGSPHSGSGGSGGTGGGGAGGTGNSSDGTAGTANTGGGGGSGGGYNYNGANGGSGIVIIRYIS